MDKVIEQVVSDHRQLMDDHLALCEALCNLVIDHATNGKTTIKSDLILETVQKYSNIKVGVK